MQLEHDCEFLCPYCHEQQVIRVELVNASMQLIQDCQVCCQPIQLTIVYDAYDNSITFDAYSTDE